MKGMSENVFINVKNRSLTITADVEIPARGAKGVVLAQGGRFGGWSLYFKDGKPMYTYNFLVCSGSQSPRAVRSGWQGDVRFAFAYDGGGLSKAAWARST